MQESRDWEKNPPAERECRCAGFANGDITSIETAVECLEKVRLTELQ